MTMREKFDVIRDSYYNGAISQCKNQMKALSRADRYDLVVYIEAELSDEEMATDIIKWCIKGEL